MNGSTLSPKTWELAQWLLDHEAAASRPSDAEGNMPAAFHVSEKLRHPLSALMGAIGFRALLARALTLAKAQLPSLNAVQVKRDGSLEGLNGLRNDEAAEASVTLIAQLLGLLGTFIGENLMLRLVRDMWPDVPVNNAESREGKEA
jgi:hypothetical protein